MLGKLAFLLCLSLAVLVLAAHAAALATPAINHSQSNYRAATDVVVNFPDPNLQSAIRQAINKPTGDIYQSDLLALTIFRANDKGIANLSGLEYCTNLFGLELRWNPIENLAPLASLTNLTTLSLYNRGPDTTGYIQDISPLTSLNRLVVLDLGFNQVNDISALAGLTNLDHLYLYGNKISDISVLSGLNNLGTLTLSGNPITDFTPLSVLTHLQVLSVNNNNISNLDFLTNLVNLETLEISDNKIVDLTPITGLRSTKSFSAGNNKISNLNPIAGLTNLDWLNLYNNQITDITALSNLTNLSGLVINGNYISDLSPLVANTGIGQGDIIAVFDNLLDIAPGSMELVKIQTLVERGAQVYYTSQKQIVSFPDPNLQAAIRQAINRSTGDIYQSDLLTLTSFTAENKGIVNLSGLEYCMNLTDLRLNGNQITNITSVGSLIKLTWLNLSGNPLGGVASLASLTSLTGLNLQSIGISDISALSSLTALREAYLTGNQISNLSPLISLTHLEVLAVQSNQISNIASLAGLTTLRVIQLDSNQIVDISAVSGLTNLTGLYLSNNRITTLTALVNNTGLGQGDIIDVSNNYLDIRTGMPEMVRIQTLIGRGAQVTYTPQRTYTLTINVTGSGTTNPAVGVSVLPMGSSVQITATPSSGWIFDSWSGDASGNANPFIIAMNGNKNITANFTDFACLQIQTIKSNPAQYAGLRVQIIGTYRGWESGHGSPPLTRSDWVIQDVTGSIYVSGSSLPLPTPTTTPTTPTTPTSQTALSYPRDLGKSISIIGVVRLKNGVPYVEITTPVATTPSPTPRPTVPTTQSAAPKK